MSAACLPALTVLLLMLSLGCQHSATVTPRIVESPGASFGESGERDSDIFGFVYFGGQRRAWVAGAFRDEYNDLIAKYGHRFTPPITKDYGVTPLVGETAHGTNTFLITKKAMGFSGEMHAWKASGQ